MSKANTGKNGKTGKTGKTGNKTWLFVGLGVLGIGGTVGLAARARSRSTDASSGTAQYRPLKNKTLLEVASSIRAAVLVVDGCSVTWRLNEASRTQLLGHRDDFFIPAIADARAKGATTVDEISAHLASLLVPGCAWPPTVIQDFTIDDAIAGNLTFIQQQAWTIAQSMGAVRLYLTIRQVVAALATQNRRG